jgi:GTP-binding protein
MMDSVRTNEPPSMHGKRLKIMYTTQAETCPPTFILFVNEQNLMHFSYKRYIENCLRRAFNFEGTPIRMIIREQGKEDE